MSKEVFDVAILGGGPAGYVCAHAVYLEKGLLAVAGKACKMSDRFCNRAQQQLWLPRAFYAVPRIFFILPHDLLKLKMFKQKYPQRKVNES